MELLVATWTLRLTLFGALAVGALSFSAGTPLLESIDRAAVAAFAFTFLGRQLVGWLETPEQRVLRLRTRREKSRGKSSKDRPTGSASAQTSQARRRPPAPASTPSQAESAGSKATSAGKAA